MVITTITRPRLRRHPITVAVVAEEEVDWGTAEEAATAGAAAVAVALAAAVGLEEALSGVWEELPMGTTGWLLPVVWPALGATSMNKCK